MKTVVVPSTSTTTTSSSSIVVVSGSSTGSKALSSSSSSDETTTTTTSLLRKIGRRGNGLKKKIVEASKRSFNCSSTAGGSGDAANDVSVDETLGLSSIEDDEDDDDTGSTSSRIRRVKFSFPEVTDVQTSYRVPHQDKYKFYYTKENIAFFKREYDIERTPTCGQAMQDSFWNAMWNFSGSSPSTTSTRSPRSKYLSGGTSSTTRLSSRSSSPNNYNFPSICYDPCSNGYFESPPRYNGVIDLGPLAITNQGTSTDNSRTTGSNTTTQGILRLRNPNTTARRINYDDQDKENLDITAAFEREYVSCSSRMGFGCRPLH